MYKLLIVDDEKIAREGLMQKVNWIDYGIEPTKMAEDAEDALDIVNSDKPDLVIADVNMPGMDGLELAKLIMESSPNTRIIVLSGHNDYKFVAKALRNKVFDYLLKPVETGVLVGALQKAIKDIESEIRRLKNLEALQKKLEESIPVIREKCIYYLLAGYMDLKQINEFYTQVSLDLDGPKFISVALTVIAQKNSEMKSFQLDMIGIKEMMQKIIKVNAKGEMADFSAGTIGVVLNYDKDKDKKEIYNQVYLLCNLIYSKILSIYQRDVKIGIGSIYSDSSGIAASFSEALEATGNYPVSDEAKILFFTDISINSSRKEHILYPINEENMIIQALNKGEVKDAKESSERFFNKIMDINGLVYPVFKSYGLRLVYTIFRKISEWDIPTDILEAYHDPVEIRVRKSNSAKEIIKVVNGFVSYVAMSIIEKRKRENCTVIEKAIRFMENNSNMSIHDVADHVYLTHSYFSVLFKKTIGKTALEYLTSIRMGKARQLLMEGSAKIYEVGEKVGYTDTRYFIKIYKKHFGVTPGKEGK